MAKDRSGRRLTPAMRVVYGIAGIVIALGIAEFLTSSGLVDGRYVPRPSQVLAELTTLFATPQYWTAVLQTLQGWGIGFLLAFAIAVPAGILVASLSIIRSATRPLIEFLRPVPSVALIPVAILLFGTQMEPKVFLVTFACIWPLLIQTVRGLRDIDPTQITTAESFRIPARDRVLRVIIPGASPYIVTGVRIAATTGLLVAVTCEFIIGSPGLGKEIVTAQSGNAIVLMYGLIVTAGALGILINVITLIIESRVLSWHPSYREVVR